MSADLTDARVPVATDGMENTAPSERVDSNSPPPGSCLEKVGIVLPKGGSGAWDDGMVESPTIWRDSCSGRYGMVYTGYDHRYRDRRGYGAVGHPRIGLAWSDDLRHWEKDPRNPIFGPWEGAGGYDRAGAAGPLIWQEDGLYHLFYFGTTAEGYEAGRKTMNLAISRDLVDWERFSGNPVIEPGGDGWRRDAIWHPHLQKVDGIYYLFFNASGVVDGHEEEYIGFASSDDLRHWRVHDEDCPLLVGSRQPGAWDASGRTGDPSLYRVGDTWYMAYYSWDEANTQDGLAMTSASAFPLGWAPWPGNPILPLGSPGTFDALHAGKPYVVRNERGHFHFYTAVDEEENREIALAVEKPG